MSKVSNTLKMLEDNLRSRNYTLIYAKGMFTSNLCMLNEDKLVVVNIMNSSLGKIQILQQILDSDKFA